MSASLNIRRPDDEYGEIEYGYPLTPASAAPVSKCVGSPPACSVTRLWAGQNLSGIHCTTRSLSHSKRPVMFDGELMWTVRSATARSATSFAKVTTTGAATPTTRTGDATSRHGHDSNADCDENISIRR